MSKDLDTVIDAYKELIDNQSSIITSLTDIIVDQSQMIQDFYSNKTVPPSKLNITKDK